MLLQKRYNNTHSYIAVFLASLLWFTLKFEYVMKTMSIDGKFHKRVCELFSTPTKICNEFKCFKFHGWAIY
jgi:hypothetical protein